jgi:integrase
MIEKRLASGSVAYYWNPPVADLKKGFKLHREALGAEYGEAVQRAGVLNEHLYAWRQGRGAAKDLDLQPGFGTLDWLVERYYRSRAFEKVSDRVRPSYRRELSLVTDHLLKNGNRVGALLLGQISARFVDKLYGQLLVGGKKARRVRQANVCISRTARAWAAVQRLYPKVVPAANPFAGLERETAKTDITPATRDEAYALSAAIAANGHPHLALVPLICFEWLQRPENVLDGYITWADWRSSRMPQHVHVFHHKTGERVWQPLEDEAGLLFPEIESVLAELPRLGVPIVLTTGRLNEGASRGRKGAKGEPRPYSHSYAKRIVREARRAAGLPEHVTMTACRHGGMTELGDAELTEQGVMALSGHRSPAASRLYVKRTEAQRIAAARKRRAWVEKEQTAAKIQNEPTKRISE